MFLPLTLSPSVYRALLPRERVRAVDWAQQHVPAPSIIKGLLRFDLFPYMIEVLDALDSPDYDVITLQFAARGGKTTGVQAWLFKEIHANPHNAIWAEPDEPSLARVLRRTWRMVDGCQPIAIKAAPPHRRSNRELRFEDCVIFGAYSGSPSTAADEAARICVLNELDKFSHRRRLDRDGNESGEADFADLVRDRATGWAASKIVQMSTPSIKGRSRIEAEFLAGDRRRYHVPCPHCGHFQQLKTGRSHAEPGGVKFKKAGGKLCAETAAATAWYECERCRGKILDEHRYAMVNAGRWLKEGLSIDRRGRIRGMPVSSGRHASFGELHILNALLPGISIGWVAAAFVNERTNPLKSLQNFTNAIEGRTWDPTPPATTPHQLAQRLRSDLPRREIPRDACFLTLGADVGVSGTQLVFYWLLAAWRNHGTGHVCDWGAVIGESDYWDLYGQCARHKLPLIAGADSGGGMTDDRQAVTERIYAMCRGRRDVWPVKGSSTWSSTDWYKLGFQRASTTPRELKRKRRAGLGDLLIVSSTISQSWREGLVYGRLKPGDVGFVTLPAEVATDPDLYLDFLQELTADVLIDGKWQRRGANEYGDALRIARVLAELHTSGGRRWGRLPDPRRAKSARKTESTATKPGRFSLLGGRERPTLTR